MVLTIPSVVDNAMLLGRNRLQLQEHIVFDVVFCQTSQHPCLQAANIKLQEVGSQSPSLIYAVQGHA
jgi:hypothetical protein